MRRLRREHDLISGTVFEHANNAAFVMDPERDRILAANGAGCRLLGYTHEELLATPISWIHPAELPELSELVERVLRQGRASTIKLTCRTKQGNFLPTEISLHALEIAGQLRILGLVLDRSEHRARAGPAAEPSLSRHTAASRTLAERCPQLIERNEQ
jgi:PAS domain S-box-containing protein